MPRISPMMRKVTFGIRSQSVEPNVYKNDYTDISQRTKVNNMFSDKLNENDSQRSGLSINSISNLKPIGSS